MVLTSASSFIMYAAAEGSEDKTEYIFKDSFEEFETGATPVNSNWTTLHGNVDVTVSGIGANDGSKCVKIEDPSDTANTGLRTKHIPVTPGTYYYIEADVKCGAGSGQLYYEFWDASKTRLTPVEIQTSYDADWETLSANVCAPDKAVTLTVLLTQTVANIGTAYYDNVKISLGDQTGAPPAGSNEADYYDPTREVKNIADGYPRLFFTKDEKDEFIAKKDDTTKNYAGRTPAETAQYIIKQADIFVDETSFTCSYYDNYTITYEYPLTQPPERPNPPTYNNPSKYPYWTALGGAIRNRLQYLATAYVLTGDEKYAEKATSICMSLAEWNSWSEPSYGTGNACLDSGYITFGVCTAYDFLYDYFTDEQRETIKEAIYKYGLVKPMKDWNLKTDHNIQVVLTSGFAVAACTIMGEYEEETTEAINKALAYFNWYLDNRANSQKHEGNMYTSLSLEYLMYAAGAIEKVTGDKSIFEHVYISDVLFDWMIAGGESNNGWFANISDGSESVGFFATASILNKTTGHLKAGYYLKRSKVYSNSLEGLLYGLTEPVYEVPGQDLQSVYLDRQGWGSMRTGWNKGDITLVFTSSQSNLGHNHYDNNSFLISKDGVWLATDPGYQDYSRGDNADFSTKYGHSTIYVDDKAQNVLGQSSIEEKLTSGFFAYMIGSAEKAYRNPKLTQFDRTFIMVNHENFPYFIVKDDIEAPDEHVYTWRLNVSRANQTRLAGETIKVGNTIQNTWFECIYPNSIMTVSFATDTPLDMIWTRYKTTTPLLVDVKDSEAKKDQDYLSIISVSAPPSSTINLAELEADIKKSSEDFEVSITAMDARKMIYFKPTAADQYITVPINVPATDNYKLRFDLATAKSYGITDIYIGDTFVGTFDGYVDNYLDFEKVYFENVFLEAGSTELKFVSKGSSVGNEKFNIGAIALVLEPADPASTKVLIDKNIDNDDARGCYVKYGGEYGAKDLLLFAKGKGIDTENVKTEGSYANILGLKDNEMTSGFIVTDAKSLTYNGKLLYQSPVATSAAFTFNDKEGSVVKSSAAVTVKVYVPEEKLSDKITGVTVGGEAAEYKLDAEGYLNLSVPKGETYINFTFASDAAADEDPNAPAEDGGNNNILLWVGIGAAAVAVVAVVALLLGKKKKKA